MKLLKKFRALLPQSVQQSLKKLSAKAGKVARIKTAQGRLKASFLKSQGGGKKRQRESKARPTKPSLGMKAPTQETSPSEPTTLDRLRDQLSQPDQAISPEQLDQQEPQDQEPVSPDQLDAEE